MQRRGADAVLIDRVTTCDSPQLFNVEVGVLDLQRVKGPLNELEATGHRLLTLQQLDPSPQPSVPVILSDGEHVGVQIGVAAANTRHGQCEAYHVRAIEGAQDLSAYLLGDDEKA